MRIGQRFAGDEFHHDERGAVGFTELVDARDIRMSERRKRSCFSLQSLD
jgi:hypothetical protein